MNKPDFISLPDWKILKNKYSDDFIKEQLDRHYPIQYLIGDVDFYGNKILVNESVLIPRSETELLVENTIKLIKENNLTKPRILDIGTGSGCIAITLAKELNINVDALDLSNEALTTAKENARLNNVQINFMKKDILTEKLDSKYDVIISNPPYIEYGDEVDLQTKYEPQNALFADNKGLIFYEEIIKKSKKYLNKGGIIAFEIGMMQAKAITDIVKQNYSKADIIVKKDYNNRDRMLFIINKD